ncbi:MAG: sulfatase [Rubrobacteraceae bacterium]
MKRTGLTRKEFLKAAGAGAAGMALLGGAGCGPADRLQAFPDEYLPSGGSRMNVVLVIVDSLRKDHVGAYGSDRARTPNIDALAGESLRFTQAYPESMPTICARRAIHTGLRTFPFKDWSTPKWDQVTLQGWQPIPSDQTTLAEILREEGYQNLLVTDTLHMFRPSYNFQRGFTFDFIRGQQTDLYKPSWTAPEEKVNESLLTGNPVAVGAQLRQYFANTAGRETEEDWFAPRLFSRASRWLEVARHQQPFFLVVDSYDPHEPWDPPEEYVKMYSDGYEGPEPYTPVYGPVDYLTERQLTRMHARYSAEVTMMDRWLGRFLDSMEDLGLFENTLLIFLSDHGHAFGEHGIVGKLPSALWPEITDVPFLIRHPGGKGAGQTSDFYASTHDVAPTILGMLGVEPPGPMDGQDLSALLDGGEPEEPRPHFTSGYDDRVWARDDRYVFFSRKDGTEARLYDVREDPEMNNDIAGRRQDVLNRMFNDYVLEDAGGSLPEY